ncbi:hypothetical protein NEOC65_000941 [Neochlamydia sp. AcF65]|nr:hypothetical protein [Neochlamydia sp. AcF65]
MVISKEINGWLEALSIELRANDNEDSFSSVLWNDHTKLSVSFNSLERALPRMPQIFSLIQS